MADYPIGTYRAGDLIADIETLMLKNLDKKTIDEKFPRKLILNELNRHLQQINALSGSKNDADYSDTFSIDTNNDTINMYNLDFEKIDKITAVTYGDGKPCIEVDEKAFYSIKSYGSNSNYKSDVIYHRKGTILYFHKGSSVNDYGVRTIWYTRIPDKVSTYNDYIDIKDTDINTLKNLVITGLVNGGNQQIELRNIAETKESEKQERSKHSTVD